MENAAANKWSACADLNEVAGGEVRVCPTEKEAAQMFYESSQRRAYSAGC